MFRRSVRVEESLMKIFSLLVARTNTCADSFALRMINNRSATGFGYKYQAGHACAGTMGYCDVFGQCRLVDAEEPLSRLKSMLLNEDALHTFTEVARVSAREGKIFQQALRRSF